MTSLAHALEALRVMQDQNSPPAAIKEATVWLENFQNTPEAWSICDQLLYQANNEHAAIFAGTCLHRKMETNWAELPAEAHESLRSSLINHCKKFHTSGPMNVLRKLSQALATLCVQMKGWDTFVNDLFHAEMFGPLPNLLLEVLQALPDVANANGVYVHPERRTKVLSCLSESRSTVVPFIERCLLEACSKQDIRMQEKVLQCLFAWLRADVLFARDIVSSQLLTAPFDALAVNQLFDVSKDVICELLRSSEDINRDAAVVQVLVPRVMQLAPAYEQAAAKQDDDGGDEITRGLCYIFSELGESYLPLLVQGSPDALQFIELLVKCAANPDAEVSRRTFDFWYRLKKSILDDRAHTPEQIAQLKAHFSQAFLAVNDSVVGLLKCPDDFDDLSPEEQEDFRRLRNEVADVLQDCCEVSGGYECLSRIFAILQRAAQNISDWQGIEACFYAIRRIHRYVSTDEAVVLPQLLPMLPRLPMQQELNYTATLVVGAYADWVEKHPEFMGDLFKFVIARLGDPKVLSAACISIRNLCDACNHRLAGSIADLLKVFEGIGNAHIRDKLEMINGICCVISALPAEQVQPAMQQMMMPPAAALQAQLQADAPDHKAVCQSLQQITAIIQHTKVDPAALAQAGVQHPTLALYVALWPILDMCFTKMGANELAVEETCRACKYTIKSLRHEFVPHLQTLMERMVSCYKAKPMCSYLDVAAVSLVELGDDQSLHQPFLMILQTFSEGTLQALNGLDDFTNNPDLVDDYFELVKRYIQNIPGQYVTLPYNHLIFQKAIVGCCIDHPDASRAILSFLTKFLELAVEPSAHQATAHPIVRAIMETCGQPLVGQLFQATMGAVPIRRLGRIGALLKRLFQLDAQATQGWVQAILGQMSFVDESERIKLLQDLMANLDVIGDDGDDKLGDILTDFARICRLSRRQ